jgi:hypothetical protein
MWVSMIKPFCFVNREPSAVCSSEFSKKNHCFHSNLSAILTLNRFQSPHISRITVCTACESTQELHQGGRFVRKNLRAEKMFNMVEVSKFAKLVRVGISRGDVQTSDWLNATQIFSANLFAEH